MSLDPYRGHILYYTGRAGPHVNTMHKQDLDAETKLADNIFKLYSIKRNVEFF